MEHLTVEQILPSLLSFLPKIDKHWQVFCVSKRAAGTVLFKEIDPGASFYAMLIGQFDVIKANDTPKERWIRVLGPGEFLGETALLDLESLRTVTLRVQTEASVACLRPTELEALMQR